MVPRHKLFVGLPAFNEAEVLPELLEQLVKVLSAQLDSGTEQAGRGTAPASGSAFEILVVDDGSSDRTPEVLAEAAARWPLRTRRHERNQNLGGAMRTLFAMALEHGSPNDVLVCMDADNTFRPEEVLPLADLAFQGADLVVSSRYVPGGGAIGVPPFRQLTSFVANRLFRTCFPMQGISEYTCSFRAYRLELLARAREEFGDPWILEDGFTSMPEILLRLGMLPLTAEQVPVCIRYDRKVGASKMKVARNVLHTFRLLWTLRRYWRRSPNRVHRAPAGSAA